MRPANDLKAELLTLKLSTKGRKPDLVNRLAEYFVTNEDKADDVGDEDYTEILPMEESQNSAVRLSGVNPGDDTNPKP